MSVREDGKKNPLKRKDLGIAGAFIVLAEAFSNFQSSRSVSSEIMRVKDDLAAMKVEREQYFVRKTELQSVTHKLDKMNEQLIKVDDKIAAINRHLKREFSTFKPEPNDSIVGCSYIKKEGFL